MTSEPTPVDRELLIQQAALTLPAMPPQTSGGGHSTGKGEATSVEQLELGQLLRDEGVARVEAASDDQDRAVIDQAIRAVADRGRPFSANDVRPLLPPGIRPALVGARFLAASKRRQIVKVGWVPSTDPGTHAHPVALWVAAEAVAA